MTPVEEVLREVYRDAEELASYNNLAAKIEADPLATIELRQVAEDLADLLRLTKGEMPSPPPCPRKPALQRGYGHLDAADTMAAAMQSSDFEQFEERRTGESDVITVDHMLDGLDEIRYHLEEARKALAETEHAEVAA